MVQEASEWLAIRPHQQTEIAEEEGDATALLVQHREGKAPMIEEKEDFAPLFEYETRGRTPEVSLLESTSTRDVEEIEGPSRLNMVALRRVTRSAFATKWKADSSLVVSTPKRARF